LTTLTFITWNAKRGTVFFLAQGKAQEKTMEVSAIIHTAETAVLAAQQHLLRLGRTPKKSVL
jgi:hypothetical protein